MNNYSHLFSLDTASFFRSPVRDIFKRVDLNAIYSFAGGYPSADTFPLEDFRRIMSDVIDKVGAKAFQYGATQGVTELREALSGRYGVPLERIQITSSSQQGIDVCTRILVDPRDVILASSPSYLGALQSFRSYRADVRGVEYSPDPEKFAEAYRMAAGKALSEGKRLKFIYSIPDFQNPSGETLPVEHRRMLVDVARHYGMLIVEDSPYRELRYEPSLLDKIYVCKQSLDLCPPVFDQYVAAEFISGGSLDRNLRKSVDLYRSKRDVMLEMLDSAMPHGVKWTRPEGGLFVFLTLPEGFDSVKFYDMALDAGVAYVAGNFFYPDGGGRNTMRLNFSFMTETRIREGISLLASLLSEYIVK